MAGQPSFASRLWHRLRLLALAVALVTVSAPVTGAEAGPKRTAAAAKKAPAKKASAKRSAKKPAKKAGKKVASRGKRKGSIKQCTGKGKRRSCKRIPVFSGHGVAKAELRTEPLTKPSGHLVVHAENFRETLDVQLYQPDGEVDPAVLAQLDELFRCKRTGEVRAVDPRLYEMLSRIVDHFDGATIELVSGFRYAERNSSRHYHASAMDIRIKGVGIREMYDYAQTLDQGGLHAMGVGIYPNSGFIHVDLRAPGDPSYRWTDRSGPRAQGKPRKKAPRKAGRKPSA